jgi:hypothetical protein
MLAHRIDFADRGTAAQQGLGDGALLGEVAAGASQFADAPPETSTRTRSSLVAPSASASTCSVAARPAASGIGWPASITGTSVVGRP